MRAHSEVKIQNRRLELLRPLLRVWRTEINTYLDERGFRFREDGSNASDIFLRNRIRANLVPCLQETFRRDVTKAVARVAELAADESDFLDAVVADCDIAGRVAGELSVPKLRDLGIALQRRVLLAWLRERGVANVGFDLVERVRSMIDDESVAKVNRPGDKHARRRRKVLFVE
jgi:tRNA(Ile)-lysidine synthase